MKNIEMIPSEKTFVEWVNNEFDELNLTDMEAGMLLGYIGGHGYGVSLDATDTMILVDSEEPENGVVARGFDEIMRCIHQWNYEFIEDSEVIGAYREQIYIDAEMMSRISDRMDCLEGHPIGMPTVKEWIAILSKFPEDYRVTCCGAENYLHLFSDKKYLTIDNERCLA